MCNWNMRSGRKGGDQIKFQMITTEKFIKKKQKQNNDRQQIHGAQRIPSGLTQTSKKNPAIFHSHCRKSKMNQKF